MIKISQKGLKQQRDFFKNAPKASKKIETATLNTLAFGTKKNIQRTLGRYLVIRNPNFMRSSVKVEKATLARKYSEVGSIERPRFSGWEEQQTGTPSESHRVLTGAARGSSFQNVARGPARLKPSNTPLQISNYVGGRYQTRSQRTIAMFKDARKQHRSVLIARRDRRKVGVKKRLDAGLYGYYRGKLLRLQKFGESWSPKRIDWMGEALNLTHKQNDYYRTFAKEFERFVARYQTSTHG